MIQELDDPRQDSLLIDHCDRRVGVVMHVRLAVDDGRRRDDRTSVGFVFEDGVEEDLEGVGKVDEVLVVGCEEDGFLGLVAGEVEANDVV